MKDEKKALNATHKNAREITPSTIATREAGLDDTILTTCVIPTKKMRRVPMAARTGETTSVRAGTRGITLTCAYNESVGGVMNGSLKIFQISPSWRSQPWSIPCAAIQKSTLLKRKTPKTTFVTCQRTNLTGASLKDPKSTWPTGAPSFSRCLESRSPWVRTHQTRDLLLLMSTLTRAIPARIRPPNSWK